MNDGVFVVIVTYGNRFHLLKQAIDSSIREGVHKIIVVDNHSEVESRNKLMEYEKSLNGKIKVLYLDDNYGSAGGFKRGLETAYNDPECEFILLLDDDNEIKRGAVSKLFLTYSKVLEKLGTEKFVLLAFRPVTDNYTKLLVRFRGKRFFVNLINPLYDTYKGFHITNLLFLPIRQKIKRDSKDMFYKGYQNDALFELDRGSYSGLFFSKRIIRQIGFPNEKFYLYCDDLEYTLRMTKRFKYRIFVVLESEFIDLDVSYDVNSYGVKSMNPFKLYYSTRNAISLEKQYLIKNKAIYNLNKYVLKFILKILHRLGYINSERYELILKAIKDGEEGVLGKVNNDVIFKTKWDSMA